jgi:two-component system response regulator VicR
MRNKKILVVDDDPNIRELLQVNLQAAGYDVRLATDGSEALDRLRQEQLDCLILDVMMPDTDGWEVLKTVRDQYPGVRIVMLTARDKPRDRMIGKDILGADEYLTKPFDTEVLIRTLEEVCHEE